MFLNRLLFAFLVLSIGCGKAGPSLHERFLSVAFAEGKYYVLDTTKARNEPPAQSLLQQAIALHRTGHAQEAIAAIERSIDLYATPEAYYEYGNALSSTSELDDAIRAYEIALSIRFSRPELALYNIACAYSRLHDGTKAHESLRKAILSGYPNPEYFQQDTDLEFLRSQPGWATQFSELLSLFQQGNTSLIAAKKISHSFASSWHEYFFCPDGTMKFEDHSSNNRPYFKFGQWSVRNYTILIQWQSHRGGRPAGKPLPGCAARCVYERYDPFDEPLTEEETLHWQEIELNEYKHWNIEDYTGTCR